MRNVFLALLQVNVKLLYVVSHTMYGCLVFVRQIRMGTTCSDGTLQRCHGRKSHETTLFTSPYCYAPSPPYSVLPYIPLQFSSHSDHTGSGDVNYVIVSKVSGRG